MTPLLLAAVLTLGAPNRHLVTVKAAEEVEPPAPPECTPDQVPYVVGTVYGDDFGNPRLHTETLCSDPEGQAAEARAEVIDAKGFDLAPGQRVAHAAVRRIYYNPIR